MSTRGKEILATFILSVLLGVWVLLGFIVFSYWVCSFGAIPGTAYFVAVSALLVFVGVCLIEDEKEA
jgi:hypothetical protein